MFAYRVTPRLFIGGGLFSVLFWVFIGFPLGLAIATVVVPVWAIVRLTRWELERRRIRRRWAEITPTATTYIVPPLQEG